MHRSCKVNAGQRTQTTQGFETKKAIYFKLRVSVKVTKKKKKSTETRNRRLGKETRQRRSRKTWWEQKKPTPQNRTETSVGRQATTDPTWTDGHKDSSYQSCRATQVRTNKSSWDDETQVTKIKQEVNHRKKHTRRLHYQNKTGNTQTTEDDGNYFQNMLQWRFCPTAAQSHVHSTVHIFHMELKD